MPMVLLRHRARGGQLRGKDGIRIDLFFAEASLAATLDGRHLEVLHAVATVWRHPPAKSDDDNHDEGQRPCHQPRTGSP